jgi:hypothetical protein
MINHSVCKKCQAILNINDLEDNPNGVGKVCIDKDACEKRQATKRTTV